LPRPHPARSVAINFRSPRCWRRSRNSVSTAALAALVATRRKPARKNDSSVFAIASANGIQKISGRKSGIFSTRGSIPVRTCAFSR